MLFEIFDGGKFLGFEDAEHEEAAILAFANKRRLKTDPFRTLTEVRQDQDFPHREATAVSASATMLPTEQASEAELSAYRKAFELLALADEAAATAARLRDAAGRTTGTECEANIRLAEAAEVEAARIKAELCRDAHQEQATTPAVAAGRQRHDDIAIEIDDVLADFERRGERATTARVMTMLKGRAGQPASCISETALDGVIWTRGTTGEHEKLTIENLKKRIARGAKGTRKGR